MKNRCPGGARANGFTLLELMIAVVVVAILVAVAYPSYEEHLRKGRRAAAQAFLVDVASRQQQYLVDARGYALGADALTRLNVPVPDEVARFYTVTVQPAVAATPPTYTLIATPLSTTSQASDGALTLNALGAKTRAGASGW